MKEDRGLRVGEQLAALGAFEIREENEAVGVVSLEQDHAHIGQAVAVDAGERHRVRVVRLGRDRCRKPLGEKPNRIRC